MKTKKYLLVTGDFENGALFTNPLKLSEAHFISQIAQDKITNIKVELVFCDAKTYKAIFG
jgi:hypothetical protein